MNILKKATLPVKLFFATRKLGKQKLSDAQVLNNWLKDPKNKQQVIDIAHLFNQVFKGGWFSISQVMQATNYKTLQEALKILNILKLSNCLIAEERKTKEMYRIVLSPDERIMMLEVMEKKLSKQLKETQDELKKAKSK